MSDFSQNLNNFQRYGEYKYSFDTVGNLTFNSSSANFNQVYLALPLQNVIYNNNKIKTFFNVEFEEFISQPIGNSVEITSSLETQFQVIQQENISLKTQLDDLIFQNETSGSLADQMAIKQVILELRKALGQGRVESDFSDTFPYTSIKKTT